VSQTVHIGTEQLDKIAAAIRVRGYPSQSATVVWRDMSAPDRHFWRQEALQVLAAGQVKVR
jgi:hypothetical protein